MSEEKALVQIADPSRRDVLRSIAMAVTAAAAGPMTVESAEYVHRQVSDEKKQAGSYKPKFFNSHEYATVGRLAELIVPADSVSAGAIEAGAPEFIDLLCSQSAELAGIYTGGLAWLDAEMRRRHGAAFVDTQPPEQTALLDAFVAEDAKRSQDKQKGLLYDGSRHYEDFSSYSGARVSDLGPGVYFFGWIRKMTVDAFYTSEIGIKDVGYVGNEVLTKYEVPREAIEYALNRSPFGKT